MNVLDGLLQSLKDLTKRVSRLELMEFARFGTGGVTNILNLGIDQLPKGVAAPTAVNKVNYCGYEFSINDDGYVRSFEVPYDWDDSTALSFNIHWYCNNATKAKFIKWQVDYSACAEDVELVSKATTTTDSGDVAVSDTAWLLNETKISLPAANFAFDDVIGIIVKRVAAGGGGQVVPDNEPVIISLELEYIANRLGEPV
jgi:hypothetical protein